MTKRPCCSVCGKICTYVPPYDGEITEEIKCLPCISLKTDYTILPKTIINDNTDNDIIEIARKIMKTHDKLLKRLKDAGD